MKRVLAIALCLALALPTWWQTPAGALDVPNVVKEGYTFYQRTKNRAVSAETQAHIDSLTQFNSAYQSTTYIRGQGADMHTSWAAAAISAMEASYGRQARNPQSELQSKVAFSETHMLFSLSSDGGNTLGFPRAYDDAGNRNMAAAYMMRGKLGGPVTGFPDYPNATYILPSNLEINGVNGERHFVSGVTYIPEAQSSNDAAVAALYISRIKDAIFNHGAAAASLYMGSEYFYEGQYEADYTQDLLAETKSPKTEIYHHPYRTAADHSVTIVGWDDTPWKYEIPTPTKDEPEKTTIQEHKGAFLVRDSIVEGGVEYWVSYETILSGAYYVEGFLVEEDRVANYEYTYEHDVFGFNSAMGYNTTAARFAAVFTVAGEADSLEAVSLFLTGENSSASLYYVPDYKTTDDLKTAVSKGTKILDSATKTLPGYYTFPLENPLVLGAKGTKFALVAVVDSPNSTSPIPVQSLTTSLSGTGRSFISSTGSSWTDSYAQGQATVCLKAHVNQDVDIPLENVSLPAGKDPETDETFTTFNEVFGTLDTLRVEPDSVNPLGPLYQPLNATDVAKHTVVWKFYNETGEILLVTIDQDSDAEVRIETPKEYAEGEEKPVAATFRYATGQLHIPAGMLAGGFTVEVEVQTFASDDDKDREAEDRLLSGDVFTARGMVQIRAVSATSIKLDKEETTLKAGSSVTVKATIEPADSSYKQVTWKVAPSYAKENGAYRYTDYNRGYDAGDPYHPDGPLVTISEKGKVTALRDGVCYVYAEIIQPETGNTITSPPFKVTVSKANPTGVTVSKKKLTMSTGTKFTLKGTVKPTAASNKRITWSSSDSSIVAVDAQLGIMEAKAVGTATITATNALGMTAVCEVTVTNAPSKTVKMHKSITLALTGAATGQEVKWEVVQAGLAYNVDEPLNSTYFIAESTGKTKLKLSAAEVGEILVRAYVTAKSYDAEGNEIDERPILEESFRVSSVVALTKMAIQNEDKETITRMTICVDPSNKREPQSVLLNAIVIKPADATLLDFEWKSSKPGIAVVESAGGDNPNNAGIKVTAVSVGSTKITGKNYNSNKTVSITIKVMAFPDMISFKKTGPLTLALGKSISLKAKVSGPKGVHKTAEYSLEDENGNELPQSNGIAELGKNGKVRAIGEGTVYLVSRGAPFTKDSVTARIKIECKTLVKKVTASGPRTMLVGDTADVYFAVSPTNATVQDVKVTITTGSSIATLQENNGRYTITAKGAGRVKITVTSVDNPSRKKTLSIRIR